MVRRKICRNPKTDTRINSTNNLTNPKHRYCSEEGPQERGWGVKGWSINPTKMWIKSIPYLHQKVLSGH